MQSVAASHDANELSQVNTANLLPVVIRAPDTGQIRVERLSKAIAKRLKHTMRILVVGASGRFGSRLLPALLARGHDPIAYVRYPSKLESMLPPDLLAAITVVQGDGEDVPVLKAALEKHQCHGLVCVAGSPSARNGKGPESRQGYISAAVAQAAEEYARESGVRVRAWWMTGFALLWDPLREGTLIADRIPKFRPEHRRTDAAVFKLDTSLVAWSIICPAILKLPSETITYPAEKRYQDVVQLCPEAMKVPFWMWWWVYFWWHVPGLALLGMVTVVLYRRFPHEAVADALARDFEEEKWVGHKMGY